MAIAANPAPVRGTVNGLGVTVAQVPHAHTVSVTLVRPAGWCSERPGEAGYAHLIEHLVHQFARQEGQGTVEAMVSSVGGLSNAQTYPFHTEFTFVVPADGIARVPGWVTQGLAWSAWVDVSAADVTREVRVIAQEITHRFASSPLAGFPWIDALGTLSDEFSLSHDGFSELSDIQEASPATLRAFWDRTAAGTVLAVATPWDPSGVADALGLVRTTAPAASPMTACLDAVQPRVRALSVPSRVPVQAEVRVLPHVDDPDLARAHALLVAGLLDKDDDAGLWQAGLFGPYLGPDHRVIIRRSMVNPAVRATPVEVSSAAADHLPAAQQAALADLELRLSGTITASALLARDHAFGLDPEATRTHLLGMAPATILHSVRDLLTLEPGLVSARTTMAVPA